MPARLSSLIHRAGPVWLVILGVVSVQVGAGFAKSLFDSASPTTIVWLRLAASAVLLMLIARPALRGKTHEDWLVVVAFGAALGLMNWSIYQAFARIPLGIAVMIEFAGPLLLAVVGSRRRSDLVWIGMAALGVVLLGFERTSLDPVGVLFALLAGAAWASYVLLTARTGQRWPGLDGLAVASVVALVLLTPLVWSHAGEMDGHIIVVGAIVGVLSSVIPYSAEMIALRSLSPTVFGVLVSLDPAAAALAGWAMVGEVLSLVQWIAMGCVVVASLAMTRSAREPLAG